MKYCVRCLIPSTRPNIRFDSAGVCNACRSHEAKRDIDWEERKQAFRAVVEHAKKRAPANGYDCLIPVSGGKDSTWQVVQCLEHGLRPLAVTWKTPARTELGRKNLENLVRLGVDHIDYQVNPKVEARFMLKALERFGSTAIPMHMALFSIPLRLAVKLEIPLVVWGENSAFEYGSAAEAHTGFRLDANWLRTYGVTHGTIAEDWVDSDLSAKDLAPYFGVADRELEAKGISAVFLGYYFPWDPQETYRVARAHGFTGDAANARTGYYEFADIDDDFISIHHYIKWYKFGFTRAFDNLSLEIRNGRISRDAAIAVVRELGEQLPRRDIEKFCAFTGISETRFFAILEKFRNREIWYREEGKWKLRDFLLPDWQW